MANLKIDENKFTILCFFSIYNCSSCLRQETEEWSKITSELVAKYRVIGVCIDDESEKEEYINKYNPNFEIICNNKDNELNKAASDTPFVIIVSGDFIIYSYKVTKTSPLLRKEFYRFLGL